MQSRTARFRLQSRIFASSLEFFAIFLKDCGTSYAGGIHTTSPWTWPCHTSRARVEAKGLAPEAGQNPASREPLRCRHSAVIISESRTAGNLEALANIAHRALVHRGRTRGGGATAVVVQMDGQGRPLLQPGRVVQMRAPCRRLPHVTVRE